MRRHTHSRRLTITAWLVGIALTLSLSASRGFGQKAQAADPLSGKDAVQILSEKCLLCHGDAQMSKLDLRTRAGVLKGGEKGPAIELGNAEASRLYKRITGQEKPAMPMAPMTSLTASEIAVVKNWIDQGAPWSESTTTQTTPPANKTDTNYPALRDYKGRVITDADRQWWSFKQPVRYPVPAVAESSWAKNPIDAFLLKSLADQGLRHAPAADRHTLIRRAYLDLTGLLPTPQEVDRFVNDPSPQAWEHLVDELLASPRYGERWGRHWLDVVRYADSSGYETDTDMPNAWRYRDYVIKSFNEDKPYNEFITEQLAGDELDKVTYDSLTATTFSAVGPRVRFRESDNPEYRYDYLDDMMRTTVQGFLGLSIHCARCHDHKFDPITRMDYFKTMAIFNPAVYYDWPLASANEIAVYEANKAKIEKESINPLKAKIRQLEAPYYKDLFEKKLATFPPDIQAAVKKPASERTPAEAMIAEGVLKGARAIAVGVDVNLSSDALTPEDRELRTKLQTELAEQEQKLPLLPEAEGIRDGDYRFTPPGYGDDPVPGKGKGGKGVAGKFLPESGEKYEPPPVHFGAVGAPDDDKAPIVQPGFITVLSKGTEPTEHLPSNGRVTSGRRRAFADWITSESNPLTARVMVNRIWDHHFGQGIVRTPSNFGKMGAAPSHPELLDWLATEFVRQKWSVKQMHRLIMTSQAYQMSSAFYDEKALAKDPDSIYLWRFPVKRVEAEIVRDIMLSASGKLNLEAGGPAFFLPFPTNLEQTAPGSPLWFYGAKGKFQMTKEGPDTWRRSIYSYWKRTLRYPMFGVMDLPNDSVSCERRTVTTVPTQALTLLNNDFVLLQAQYLAERVQKEAGDDPSAQIKDLYRIALSREPTAGELNTNLAFMKQEDHGKALAGVADVVLNLSEFLYIN